MSTKGSQSKSAERNGEKSGPHGRTLVVTVCSKRNAWKTGPHHLPFQHRLMRSTLGWIYISCGRPCELDDHWLKAASCFRSSNAGSGTRSENFVRITNGASTSLADGKSYVFVFIQCPLTMLSFIQGPLARLPSDPNPIPGH